MDLACRLRREALKMRFMGMAGIGAERSCLLIEAADEIERLTELVKSKPEVQSMGIVSKMRAWWSRPPLRQRILNALSSERWTSSIDLWRAVGLWSLNPYSHLMKFERAGLVCSKWADGPYPRKRLYRLTSRGEFEMDANG